MTLTLQEISDRFEIMDIMTDYCAAIDSNDIDALDLVFTSDAIIDYSKAGGPKANLQTIKKFLKENLGKLPRQHMMSNYKITIKKDLAEARSLCHNPLELPNQEKLHEVMFWGIWYNDKFVRTSSGWRIKERVTEPSYNWKIQRVMQE